ncbi:MAG: DsbA family protein [bacterium]|nr:DsbA family protein [bacterium]
MTRSFLDTVPPRTALGLGAALGVGAVGVIGFLVLLPGALRGRTSVPEATVPPATAVAAAPTPPSPRPPPEDAVGTFRPIDPRTDHIRGPANAVVKIIEYSDTECPFCKRFHPTMQQAVREYPEKVAWVYRHFPLRQLHSKAAKEAEATECANELGGNDKFWAYLDKLFEVTPANDGLDPAQLPQIAADVGLDRAKFATCLSSGRYAQHVSDDEQDGVAAGARGTPYSILLGPKGEKLPISGALPFDAVKQMIDGVLR